MSEDQVGPEDSERAGPTCKNCVIQAIGEAEDVSDVKIKQVIVDPSGHCNMYKFTIYSRSFAGCRIFGGGNDMQ